MAFFSKAMQSYLFGDQQLTEPLIYRHIHSLIYFNNTCNYDNGLSHRVAEAVARTSLNFRKNIRAEWTQGSHLLVISMSSCNIHLIITRTLFTIGLRLCSGKSPTRNYSIYFAMFIQVIPEKSHI